MKEFLDNNKDYFYFAFRAIIGVLFILHGWGKVGGLMDGTTAIFSLGALAALIEVVGGLFIVIGLFTRCTASIAAIEMAYAFFVVHTFSDKGFNIDPLTNGGEKALLFLVAFLVLAAFGSRNWAVKSD